MAVADTGTETIDSFTEFYSEYYREDVLELAEGYPSDEQSLWIDYDDLFQFDLGLADDLLEDPEMILEYAEEALRNYDLPIDVTLSDAHVRPYNLPESAMRGVGEYISDEVGELLSIRGQVTKKTQKKGIDTQIVFKCQRCGTPSSPIPQKIDEFQEPHECQGCERQGPFEIIDDHPDCNDEDFQLIRIQCPPEEADGRGTSGTIDIRLREDLCDLVSNGDRIYATGVLEKDYDENAPTWEPMLRGISIEHQETDYEDIDVSEHIDRIEEIAADDPYEAIVNSIKPTHHGHEEIKLALAHQAFGGVSAMSQDGSDKRGTINEGLIGDPGTDKSGLLKFMRDITPRSIFTIGKQSSAAGLTCAAVRDDFGDSGGWTLEAGALVEADKGLAAIDELDTMDDEDKDGLLEAMSDQQVSASKAGITATMPARTSVLAAANPKYGRYDQHESIGEQIDLPPDLFSRFDLIFAITDQPDQEKDAALADHINDDIEAAQRGAKDESVTTDAMEPEIEPEVMRAYIAHAKTIVPVITEAAKERAKEFFVTVRSAGEDQSAPVPVTARKLEALHRLAEASARMRLSESVEVQDIERVKSIVMKSLRDVGIDPESGELDVDVVETGTSKSQRERIKTVKAIINDLEEEFEGGAPVDEVTSVAVEEGIRQEKVDHEIEALKQKGEIYEPATDKLRISDFV